MTIRSHECLLGAKLFRLCNGKILTLSNLLFTFTIFFYHSDLFYLSLNTSPPHDLPCRTWPLQVMEFERYTPTAGLLMWVLLHVSLTIQNNFNYLFQSLYLVFCLYFKIGLLRPQHNKRSLSACFQHITVKKVTGRERRREGRKPCRGMSRGRLENEPLSGTNTAYAKREGNSALGGGSGVRHGSRG